MTATLTDAARRRVDEARKRALAENAAANPAKRCRCGPGQIRPRRGTICGNCALYVIGPPRPTDIAFELEQHRPGSGSRRPAPPRRHRRRGSRNANRRRRTGGRSR